MIALPAFANLVIQNSTKKILNIHSDLIQKEMSRIGANAFCVLMVISSHIDPVERKCFPSRGRMQKMTGLGEEAVRNAIKKLESLGLLEMKQSRGEHGRMKQPEYCVTSDHIGVYIPARRVRMEDSPGLGQALS